ncbi:MAG: hypothetical protein II382_07375 [Oscillospiraceae bacterium]|jgi:hypothetical protein|nr:hypothetical protein [Oscillospiraceae bacterium]
MTDFTVTLAGRSFRVSARYAETASYFPAPDPEAPLVPGAPVSIPETDWQEYLQSGMEDCAHTEYSMLTAHCSDALLAFDCVILHAAALRWRDRSWLIIAPSGVGKSTQTRNLQTLLPGEVSVICGDRPVLERCGGAFRVHPSPWNGKENWHGAEAAPLGGLILLRRGPENRLYALREDEAILNLYVAFIQTSASVEAVTKVADLEDGVLRAVPTWLLVSDTVPDSTRCLVDGIFS